LTQNFTPYKTPAFTPAEQSRGGGTGAPSKEGGHSANAMLKLSCTTLIANDQCGRIAEKSPPFMPSRSFHNSFPF